PIDNLGANAAEFDLHTIFFLNANGSALFTQSGPNDLIFRDIDDVPALGHYDYAYQQVGAGDVSGEGAVYAYVPVQYDPANLTIGLDESHGIQHTSYTATLAGQAPSQTTDDIGGQHAHQVENNAASQITGILSQDPDPSNALLTYQQGVLANIDPKFATEGAFCVKPLGVASVCLDVSFGADGKAQGNSQAGQTLFSHDGGANSTAFELYMQVGNGATTESTVTDKQLTNMTISYQDADGTIETLHVYAYQLDANTVIGISEAPKGGDQVQTDGIQSAAVAEANGGIPVFELHLDPQTGELTMVQYHQVNNPAIDGVNGPNDPLDILTDDGQQLIHFRATDYDGDHVDAPLEVSIVDDAPRICQPVIDTTTSSDPHPQGEGNCLSESTCNVVIDPKDVPGWVHISATDDKGAGGTVGISTGAGFGVDSDTDGKGQDRFHEINYDDKGGVDGQGGSESLVFNFDKLVESGTVELARFYSDENHVGNEQGHWEAYREGVLVGEGDFTANSTTGQFGFAIPTIAGGFDQLVFTGLPGSSVGGGADESDYLVQELNLNLLPTDQQTGHVDYTFGTDGGKLPSGNASSEAGDLGFQVHYTGASLTSDGHAVTVTESVVNGHILIQGTDSVTHLTVFTLDVNPGTPDANGQATATYTYTQYGPLDNNPGGSTLPFQFVVTDIDGDSTNTSLSVCLKDAAPIAGVATADVYEKGLDQPGTSHDGTAKGDGSNATSGFLNFSYNGDGPGHITSISDGTHTDTTANGSGQLVIDTPQYTLTVDQVTGYYTFTLHQNLQHADTQDDGFTNSQGTNPTVNPADIISALGFTFTVADADGSTANGTLTVQVHDDGPIVTACWNSDSRVYLETQDAQTIGAAYDTAVADFSKLFATNVTYGADGPGSTVVTYALTLLTAQGGDSHLNSHGADIHLFNVDGVIVGSTAISANGITSDNTIFSVAVDGNGHVTLTQYQEIDHGLPGASHDYDDQLASLANNLIGLTGTVTATDSDGDAASDSKTLDLGGNIKFADDGPSVDITITSDAGVKLTTHDALTIGSNSDTATADFSGLFHNTVNYGADGPGGSTTSYALHLLAQGAHVDSGLNSQGDNIYLYEINGKIVGSTSGFSNGVSSGNTIFTLSVDGSGHVTLTQFQQIDHAGPGSSSNYDSQLATLANNLVGLTETVTATDYDGDKATTSKTIDLGGNVNFADDGPQAKADTDSTVEGQSATGNVLTGVDHAGGDANTTDGVKDSSGADAPLTIVQVVGQTTDSNGGNGFSVAGLYGTLTMSANGDYTYVANKNLNNANGVTDTFSYTIKDADGDTSTTTLTISVTDGEGPKITGPDHRDLTLTVNEAALSDGSTPASNSEIASGHLTITAGSDNVVSAGFSTDLTHLVVDVNGNTVQDLFWVRVSDTQ
ncbi:MAG TPA: DUF5801 repeats-in-toxin domain-containing protein, partial [Dongiaceae bacterium]|nr:DUF5801 repeats-in-toxin domain-containing protein [Dongiaceae bacterium]